MSRLDSFIRRMQAQRDCLNWAAKTIAGLPGVVLELGLGNGRTYDHLRELLPQRDIYVFERDVRAHACSLPPNQFLILGDVLETLISAKNQLPSRAALVHMDLGTSDANANRLLANEIAPLLHPLVTTGGIIVSNTDLTETIFFPLPCPTGVKPGRYFIYRKNTVSTESRFFP